MNQNQVSNSENLLPSSDMNQDQDFISKNLPPSFTTIYSNSLDNNVNMTTAVQDVQPQYDNTQTSPQQTLQTTLATTSFHSTIFFYRPPNDFCHYYVNCKEICYDTVTYLLNKSLKENNVQSNENECIFYHKQQHDARFYQVSCEIVSPLLINNCLNKNFLGFELQNSEQEHLVFTINQKENLEYYLKQYLSLHLLN
ncbi:hypothetical protein RhiirA1_471140 [Rhizophagus irregularis]|uniref:Uncharacterized protein n=1 Tax=Rhizophagus irregularis TaxID=588596 RepID=A0A2N0R4U7_9GLOM|nr:hypothetical protein RhiirA1_471140 [Rhizophagus irregularis]CAB4494073.1 unnamed protein product [Rhizophagus irregularis]CAB5384474.1 unnamed protein product [Rhizophagus irregularis]